MNKRLSRSYGTSLVEIAAGIFVMMLLVALAADACLLVFGSYVNDNACRDAVRAASRTNNSAKALTLASHAVSSRRPGGALISAPRIVFFDYHDYGGVPPNGQTPYVQVTTTLGVKLPAPILFYGIPARGGAVSFSQSYACPIVRSKYFLPGHSWAALRPRITPQMLSP